MMAVCVVSQEVGTEDLQQKKAAPPRGRVSERRGDTLRSGTILLVGGRDLAAGL